MRVVCLAFVAALVSPPVLAEGADQPIAIVAAENFYGDIAKQVGGDNVKVTSILNNPDQDPHLFEVSASAARALADARFVIYNGIDYDPWVPKLLAAAKSEGRKVFVVATLMQRRAGDNPHLWHDPATMPTLAKALAMELGNSDPAHRADYQRRLDSFLASLQPITAKIAAIRAKHAKIAVAATEPVYGYMIEALGFTMRDRRFQMAVMNGTEPSARDIAAFETNLKTRAVKLLFFNSQASDDLTARLRNLAQASKVPVIGITETEPPNTTYQAWTIKELDVIEQALAEGNS
jgi:zinc/manganese transport system substrate-binding protein